MKIKRLTIHSFRGINHLTLDFNLHQPNVLMGINGSGKSSILDCIAILLSRFIAGVQWDFESRAILSQRQCLFPVPVNEPELVNGRCFLDSDIQQGCDTLQSEITLTLEKFTDITWSLTKVIDQEDEDIAINLTELDSVTSYFHDQWKTHADTNLPLAVYYPINRAVFEIPLNIIDEHSFQQIDAYDQALTGGKLSFSALFQWIRTLEDVENEKIRDNPNYRNPKLEAVRQAIYAILGPEFSNLRVWRSPLRITVTKKGQEFKIHQLSEGEKCLLAMAGDLARRLTIANPSLSNPLEGCGIVLIDEVELHLHPQLQQEIIPRLSRTFPHCQFIFTTHSPLVVSQLQPSSLYLLPEISDSIDD